MKPEEFAKQFFDLWQQSVGQMMRDPGFSQKMLELMQQSGQLWQQTTPTSQAHASSSSLWPSSYDGTGAKPADELAHRLELCEQRLAIIETLIRQWSDTASRLHPGAASGGYPEE